MCNEHTCAHEKTTQTCTQTAKKNKVQDAQFPAAFVLQTPNSLVNDTIKEAKESLF